jgi:hypothetical protein
MSPWSAFAAASSRLTRQSSGRTPRVGRVSTSFAWHDGLVDRQARRDDSLTRRAGVAFLRRPALAERARLEHLAHRPPSRRLVPSNEGRRSGRTKARDAEQALAIGGSKLTHVDSELTWLDHMAGSGRLAPRCRPLAGSPRRLRQRAERSRSVVVLVRPRCDRCTPAARVVPPLRREISSRPAGRRVSAPPRASTPR